MSEFPVFRIPIALLCVSILFGCLCCDNMDKVWTFESGGLNHKGLIVAEGKLYANEFEYLYCLEQSNGEVVWKRKFDNHASSRPVYHSGKIYIGTRDKKLQVMDSSNGDILRTYNLPCLFINRMVLNGDRFFIGGFDGVMYAIDRQSGNVLWSFKTAQPIHASPVIAGGLLCFGSRDYSIYALKPDTGKKIWEFKTGEDIIQNPSSDGENLYVMSHDNYLRSLKIATGELNWKFKAAYGSDPVLEKDLIYMGTGKGRFYVLDKTTGEITWSVDAGHPIDAAPLMTDDRVYVVSLVPEINCLSPDGELLWKQELKDICAAGPVSVGKEIFMVLNNGSICAYRPDENTDNF